MTGPETLQTRIAAVAARQHGLVTRLQLLEVGLGSGAVKHRVTAGFLVPVQSGVYRVGPLASPREAEMAAVLACGPDACVSHRSAAALWGMLPRRPRGEPVEITLRSGGRRRRPGIRTTSAPGLRPNEVRVVERILVTSPARTLVDLAGVLTAHRLAQALGWAERERLATPRQVKALLEVHGRRPGAGALRAILDRPEGMAFVRSELEARTLALIGRHHLPRPATNVELCGMEVDFFWAAARLVVELDGFAFHGTQSRFVGDRRRDRRLIGAGYRVVRLTWADVVDAPDQVATELGALLGIAGASNPRARTSHRRTGRTATKSAS